MVAVFKNNLQTCDLESILKNRTEMNKKSLLLVVALAIHGSDARVKNEVDARANNLVPFRTTWFGNFEKNLQVGDTPIYLGDGEINEVLAEFHNDKPRKLKNRESVKKRTEGNLKTLNNINKTKKVHKKKKRKRKKQLVSIPRRFVKMTNVEKDKDSNFTDSIEVFKKSKPVNIIVHIKVSE